MKKFLSAFLLACSATLTGIAIAGCDDGASDLGGVTPPPTPTVTREVTFEEGEGYTIQANVADGGSIAVGTQLVFQVELGAFYAGTPVAYINDEIVQANAEGLFSYTVGEENINVRIGQVHKDVSNMPGTGAFDNAFVVSRPIDLLKIAERVNAGDTRYIGASYVLANDIDCKGEELQIIGDRSTDMSYFSGSFVGYDESTGKYEKYTISNFTINSNDVNYVGLFGAVFSDMSVSSSALFYGVSLDNFTINAGIDGRTDDNKSVSVGGLVGYGVGVKTFLCDATNGEINLNADSSYFSYAGGLIGFQQGFYDDSYGAYYPAEVAYANVDVDVNVNDGVALTAGGIVGYMTTNSPYGATASVHNSYSLGSVSGALRSGGIAGGMGQYSVVSNCYSASDVSALSSQLDGSITSASPEYAHAYAGGLVGFAENDSIVHDSFFNGDVNAWAFSGNSYAHADTIVGGGYDAGNASASAQKYIALNCEYDVDLSSTTYLTSQFGWQAYDWVFAKDKLPTINYGSPAGIVTMSMTIHYVAKDGAEVLVRNNASVTLKYFDTSIQSLSSYTPIGSYMDSEGGLASYYTADNDYLSYGYFFDEACTQRVPLSYLPEKNVTLYVGFADPTPIVAEYNVYAKNTTEELTIRFTKEGIAYYTDGTSEHRAVYSFDGTNIVLEQVRLARYFDGAIVVDDNALVEVDPNFDAGRYAFVDFTGVFNKETGTLELYDGQYFTAENPLVAKTGAASYRGAYYKKSGNSVTEYLLYGTAATVTTNNGGIVSSKNYATMTVDGDTITLSNSATDKITVDGTTLTKYDAFRGDWTKSATISKTYTFDGMGGWSYAYVNYKRSVEESGVTYTTTTIESMHGTYIPDTDDTIVMKDANGKAYAIADLKSGYLTVELENGATQIFHSQKAYLGVWKGSNYSIKLNGLTTNGQGTARMTDSDGYYTDLVYEVSENVDYIALYYATNENGTTYKSSLYGYATYDLVSNTMTITTSDPTMQNSMVTDTLYLFDDYYGEWISDFEEFKNVEFTFNGLGLYSYLSGNSFGGKLTIEKDGEKTVVDYTITSDLKGSFVYGKQYDIAFDEDENQVKITYNADTTLQRKDEFAGVTFVDLDGKLYVFDGKSTLSVGGTVQVDGKDTYTYFPSTTVAGDYDLYEDQTKVGTFAQPAADANHYLLTVGADKTEIYLANEFMGDWAILNQYALFKIGPTDTNGNISANFKGSDVTLTYLTQDVLTFYYRDGKMPYTFYVFVRYDETWQRNVLVLSEFTSLMGEYFICSKVNDLYGTWEWYSDNGQTTLKFDGVTTEYSNGYAELTLKLDHITVTTPYYYMYRGDRMMMWSQTPMAGKTLYYRLDFLAEAEYEEALKDGDVYVLYDEEGNISKILRMTQVDGLYLVEATDDEGAKYFFDFIDGQNIVLVDDVAKYTYRVTAFNSDNTATVLVTEIGGEGLTYEATLDYSNVNEGTKFILGELVEEETEEGNENEAA